MKISDVGFVNGGLMLTHKNIRMSRLSCVPSILLRKTSLAFLFSRIYVSYQFKLSEVIRSHSHESAKNDVGSYRKLSEVIGSHSQEQPTIYLYIYLLLYQKSFLLFSNLKIDREWESPANDFQSLRKSEFYFGKRNLVYNPLLAT